jgi:metallopeptidase MepB
MFEKFLWTPRHMRECSLHYSHLAAAYADAWRAANPSRSLPPRQLPEETVVRLLEAHRSAYAVSARTQIMLGKWDLAVHGPRSHDDIVNMDLASVYNKMRTDMTGFASLEVETGSYDWGHGFANLRLISGGYAAYYYCYVFSPVYTYDLFYTGFKGDTMNKERGRRYRQIVLERGSSMAPMDI